MENLSEVFDAKWRTLMIGIPIRGDSNPVAAQIPIVERLEIIGEVQADVGSVEGNNEIRELVVVVGKDATVNEVHELIDEVHALVDAVAKDATIEKAKLVDEVSIDREVDTLKTLLGLIDKAGGNVPVVDVVRKRLAAIEKFPEQSVNNDSENLMLIHNVDAEDGTMFHTNDAKKLFIKIIGQTLEVNPSSKHIEFDLNVSLFPENYNEENTNEEFPAQWQRFSFKNIPSLPHAPNYVIKNTSTHRKDVACIIKNEYNDKAECIYAIGEKALREGFEYEVIISCTKRYSVKCANPECDWNIYTRKNIIGTYLGTNLLANGMDGNNQIIPISTGVSQGETIESWSWFLTKLKACIGLKPEAIKKLDEAGYSSWLREHCPENRYNYLTLNNAKSINALTRDVQKVPITKLLEYYRKLVQNWYCERRHKYKGTV
nr:transposase, MuDR, MULE transposase domain protein [Tanacetum cinerariifolium]